MFLKKQYVFICSLKEINKKLPLLGMLPLLSVIVGSTHPPVCVGADADVALDREGTVCLSDLERINVRRLAAISDLVSPAILDQLRSLAFPWLKDVFEAPEAGSLEPRL